MRKSEIKRLPEMKRLQRKLIPVNLVCCILALVSAFSLIFMPFFKIDLGKIIGNKDLQAYATEIAVEEIKNQTGNIGGGEDGEGGDAVSKVIKSIDIGTIAEPVVGSLFDSINGDLEFSAFYLWQLSSAENPGKMLMDDKLLDAKSGIVTMLAESIESGIRDVMKPETLAPVLTTVVQDVVVEVIADYLPEEYKDKVDPEEFKKALNDLDTVESEEEAIEVINTYVDKIIEENDLGDLDEETRQVINDQISELYQKTVEYTADENSDNFSTEALVCVMASELMAESGMDLGEGGIDLGKLLDEIMNGNSGDGGDGGDGGTNNGGNSDDEDEDVRYSARAAKAVLTDAPAEGGDGENEPAPKPAEKTVYTSYADLLDNMVTIPDDFSQQLTDMLMEMIAGETDDIYEHFNKEFAIYLPYAFYAFAGFAALWLIMFLFAFLHIFMKNKKFGMWYVKLLAIYPCIIFWLAPIIFPLFMPAILPMLGMEAEMAAMMTTMIPAVLGGYLSMTWISGLCYLLLWAVSIFWAHPIKHKIKKLYKEYR